MYKQIIIFGAGSDGREALDFFGHENVLCFVDNDMTKSGTTVNGKRVLSFEDMEELFDESPLTAGLSCEVVVSLCGAQRRWAMHAMTVQLKNIGIDDFSLFQDIKRRWRTGDEFVRRDTEIYPCEQESLFEITKLQFDYMLRHTDPRHMLPATGELREAQQRLLTAMKFFFKKIEAADVHPFMNGGTLLGAVRHGGFVPWDDDVDFFITSDDFIKIIDVLKQQGIKIFKYHGFRNFATDDGITAPSHDDEMVAFTDSILRIVVNPNALGETRRDFYFDKCFELGYGNVGAAVMDFGVICPYSSEYTLEAYLEDIQRLAEVQEARVKYERRADPLTVEDITDMMEKGVIDPDGARFGAALTACAYAAAYYKEHTVSRQKTYKGSGMISFYDREDIFPLQKMGFEDMELWAPAKYDVILKNVYGEDYMSLPPRVGVRVGHKDQLFTEKY